MKTTATVSMAAPRGQWSTLRVLRLARSIILLLDALLLIAIVSATETQRAALRTVGKDTVPSIIAAQHIKSAMADMDADAANELLEPPSASAAALQAYEDRRVEAAGALIGAAENITFGDAERLPIQSLQVGMGSYDRLIQRARDVGLVSNRGPVDPYHEAASVMDNVLLPAADALDKANSDVLERTYKSEHFRASASRFLIVLLSLATLGSLAVTQTMLSQRMHRTLNPALLVATLVVAVLALFSVQAISRSHDELRVAKANVFASIHVLWQARASAYAARTDESRLLLDSARAAEHGETFTATAGAVAFSSADLSEPQLIAALREGRHVDGFRGYLADELNNTSVRGERDAALATLAAWRRYVDLDPEVRRLERSGQHRRAIDLCTGSAPGQSEWAFAQFDQALGRTLSMDQAAFDGAVNEGRSALGSLELESSVAAALAACLVLLGFAPRIREYR